MMKVAPITNVNNTINKNNVHFTAGVQSNRGADVIRTSNVRNEGSFITDFLGTIKQSPLFYETLFKRQASIEKGLIDNNFNAIA